MPGFNRTGPLGRGPLTGRGLGPCGLGLRRGQGLGRTWARYWTQPSPQDNRQELSDYIKDLKEELELAQQELDGLQQTK